MEAKAVDHKRQKQAAKRSKSKPRNKRRADNKSKSRSKQKKKGGFLCCRKKKSAKKSKSRVTKTQPRGKPVKPLPPVPNEQLGDVVLVKNLNQIEKPKAPAKEKKEPVIDTAKDVLNPPKTDLIGSAKEKIETDKEDKLKAESNENVNEKAKIEQKENEKKEVEKEEREDEKKEERKTTEDQLNPEKDEKKEKWMKMARRVVDEDANMAVNDFEQVASYVPPHVTKNNFVFNMADNRFADVICVDHSRVCLSDSSYIHASWVNLNSQKKAILTQLPLAHTAADFWQMVIEQRVKCILLLLTEQEFTEFGGDFVFPHTQDFLSFEKRSIRVGEFKRVEIAKGWNLKVISVSNGDYKTFVHVHHYKTWAHDSIPAGVKQMWQVQSALRQYSSPPIYMSLSGCGRAGTYALFEAAHSSLHSENPTFDMVKCLENIRDGRVHSVQSISQFSFVYTLIAEHILGNGFCKLVKKDEDDEIDAILRQLTIN